MKRRTVQSETKCNRSVPYAKAILPTGAGWFGLCRASRAAFAATPESGSVNIPYSPAAEPPGFDHFGSLLWVIFVLVFIIGLIVLFIKFIGQKSLHWTKRRAIRVLGGASLGPNKSVVVVEIGSSLYVLGVGEDVRMLDKISDAEKAAELIRSFESERTMTGNTWMSRVFGRPRAAEPEQPPMDESVSFNELIERHMGKAADQRQMVKQLLQKENYTDRSMDK